MCLKLFLSWLSAHLIFDWRQPVVAVSMTKRKHFERVAATGTMALSGAVATHVAAISVPAATWVSARWAGPA